MPYRPRHTYQDAVDDLEVRVGSMEREIGRELLPEFKKLTAEVEALLAKARMPTRRERLGLWLMRCQAVPWRRIYSPNGTAVAHMHGPITGLIRWIGERLFGGIGQ